MTEFYKMKGPVGSRRANHPADVAFVQLAVKLNGGLIRPRGQSQTINGKYDDELLLSVLDFSENGKQRIPVHPTTSDGLMMTTVAGNRLTRYLPNQFSPYRLFVNAVGGTLVLALLRKENSAGQSATRYRASDIPLPDDLKKSLLLILNQLARRFGLLVKIERIGIEKGRFAVSLSVRGAKFINRSTGQIRAITKKSDHTLIIKRFDRNILKLGTWNFVSKNSLFLHSKKQYSFLILSTKEQRDILRSLPYEGRPPLIADEMVRKCYAAYEWARIHETLSPSRKQTFLQCFGTDEDLIVKNEAARIRACQVWERKFHRLAIKQKGLIRAFAADQRRLVAAQAAHDEFDKDGLTDLFIDIGIDLVALKGADDAKELGSGLVQGFFEVGGAVGNIVSNEELGLLDYFLIVVSFVAGVVAIFTAGTTVAVVATIVGLAATIGSIGKSLFDYLSEDERLDNQLIIAVTGLAKTSLDIANNTQIVAEFWQAMEADGCLKSIADIGSAIGVPVGKLVSQSRELQ